MTAIPCRRYTATPGYTPDFHRVCNFLLRQNFDTFLAPNFPWGRWEWIFCRPHQDTSALDRIGIWEDEGEIVALATYEDRPGEAFFAIEPGYEHLKQELFAHAVEDLGAGEDGARTPPLLMIDDHDTAMQQIARAGGFHPTQETQPTSIIDARTPLQWTLPEGFRLHCLANGVEILRYNRCLHRGFNHPGEPDESDAEIASRWHALQGPHQNLALHFVTVAPNGDYAAYCGIWYAPGEYAALVEPVCTDPTYRLLGCGKAAVLAGVQACFDAGAQVAAVGSSQQFYYNIGFAPVYNCHAWEKSRG